MSKVLIAGGGAAGMFAALRLQDKGRKSMSMKRTRSLESNRYITGKGQM